MTLRLILVRHAKSDWGSGAATDHARPLNPRGRRDAPRLGRWLASRGDVPGEVLCSDAARTRETLDLILPELPAPAAVTLRPTLYHAPAERMLAELRTATAPCVMMVGHNPGIARFAADLLHRPARHPRFADFPTCACAVIDFAAGSWAEIGPGAGALRDFVVPDDL